MVEVQECEGRTNTETMETLPDEEVDQDRTKEDSRSVPENKEDTGPRSHVHHPKEVLEEKEGNCHW